MFKIVKSATLRAQAAQLDGMRQQLATAQQEAEAARADAKAACAEAETAHSEANKARADLEFVVNDKTVKLADLRVAAEDPVRGPSVRGRLAVTVLRDQLKDAEALAAKTGRELDPGLRFLQAVLGDETDDGTLPAMAAQGSEED